jgi:hypothetical protein
VSRRKFNTILTEHLTFLQVNVQAFADDPANAVVIDSSSISKKQKKEKEKEKDKEKEKEKEARGVPTSILSIAFEELSLQAGPQYFLLPLPVGSETPATDIVNSFAVENFKSSFGFTASSAEEDGSGEGVVDEEGNVVHPETNLLLYSQVGG